VDGPCHRKTTTTTTAISSVALSGLVADELKFVEHQVVCVNDLINGTGLIDRLDLDEMVGCTD
jgi:hypothetical protein